MAGEARSGQVVDDLVTSAMVSRTFIEVGPPRAPASGGLSLTRSSRPGASQKNLGAAGRGGRARHQVARWRFSRLGGGDGGFLTLPEIRSDGRGQGLYDMAATGRQVTPVMSPLFWRGAESKGSSSTPRGCEDSPTDFSR